MRTLADIDESILKGYSALKVLPDGRLVGVMKLLYHYSLHVGIDEGGYSERYCYKDAAGCVLAMMAWDGEGDPLGWHKHPESGRRRNLETGKEWIAP